MHNNNDKDNAIHSEVRGIGRFRLLQPLADRNFFLLWQGAAESDYVSYVQAAVTEYRQWEEEGLDREAIAAKVCEPLYQRRASKAETTQFLAEYLENNPPSPEYLRSALPRYLMEAIDYVTGQKNDSGS